MTPGFIPPDHRKGLLGLTHNNEIQGLLDRIAKCENKNTRTSLTNSIKTICENVLREYLASICRREMTGELYKIEEPLVANMLCNFFGVTMAKFTGLYKESEEVKTCQKQLNSASKRMKKYWSDELARAYCRQALAMCDNMFIQGDKTDKLKTILREIGTSPTMAEKESKRKSAKKCEDDSDLIELLEETKREMENKKPVSTNVEEEAQLKVWRSINSKVLANESLSMDDAITEMTSKAKKLFAGGPPDKN